MLSRAVVLFHDYHSRGTVMGKVTERAFFNRKKPWSRIKDRVLGSYMPLYFAKLSKRGRPIVVVDAFAGPGIFEDPVTGSMEDGSPLIMSAAAARTATGPYLLLFGNKDKEHHTRLENALRARNIPTSVAQAVRLQSQDLLGRVAKLVTTHSVLLYLDPFGYKGCEFENLRPFLERSTDYSTEIILNLDVADLHRLAARNAVLDGRVTSQILSNHGLLTNVLNGEWWKTIMLDSYSKLPPAEVEKLIVSGYIGQYAPYFKYRGCCPVPERAGGQVKYYITFFSNHPDALIAHNDNMCFAYNDFTFKQNFSGPLFGGVLEEMWQDIVYRDYRGLDALIMDQVRQANANGWRPSRTDAWLSIISQADYFRKWTQSEYRQRVKILCTDGHIKFVDVRRTNKLNDDSELYIPGVEIPTVGELRIKRQNTA